MRIRIKTLTRHTFVINVPQNISIDELKARLTQETGIPLQGQRLIYKGEELGSGSIEDKGFAEGDFLVVVVVAPQPLSESIDSSPRKNDTLSRRARAKKSTLFTTPKPRVSILADDVAAGPYNDAAEDEILDKEHSVWKDLVDAGLGAARNQTSRAQLAREWLLEHSDGQILGGAPSAEVDFQTVRESETFGRLMGLNIAGDAVEQGMRAASSRPRGAFWHAP